ncbi:phosphate/phosphite/phosphonate ABC transporter substrate-binding protein [Sediminicurvatus halobius]|uniref:Phosphate/phosphite/phosphonate ABC transporter substrate-binding protein n=1 Tax=Sediminicurvatus halobius TaxID=2182432 RepID=A0A2U2N7R6_9GAMM|nr:phosphate/phosphite/phosphonate ABC transporter substrate-binding protein [Spiribacter halobius]PWG65113.1 phosphate/phosphite/phosphonate ABC transporter substrate-binding protein [Spiribacter halobius]UEX78937.1 phosphate/phosphite/phosphonate ABC transporter substrate-binding protein [Spiribacter halobius]
MFSMRAEGSLPASLFGAAIAGALLFGASQAPAQMTECVHRGDLAERYCDDDLDLVADLPLDESEWEDPDTLFFSYVPVEDPAIYADVFEPFIAHLEEVTGKDVRYFSAQSYAAQIEALRSGRLHVAGLSTGSVPFGVNIGGFVPFTIMGTDEGQYGYRMQVITHRDSGIESLDDLRGETVAHTEQASNSGNQAPRALLAEQGVVPGEDYEVVYSGGHDRSILGVANQDYVAAPVASSVLDRMADRGVVDREDLRVIFETASFPTTGFGHAHNLHPRVAQLVKKAFFTFDFEGTSVGEEFTDADQFIPITYRQHWVDIRTIQRANDVEYTQDALSE